MPSQKDFLKGFGSVAIHSGHEADGNNAHLTPIYASSTYVFDTADQGMRRFNGEEKGYIYSRWGNPTMTEAEQKISALESFGITKNGEPLQLKSILHSSGMAAISALLLGVLKSGDKILSHFSLYGGTQELMDKVLPQLGIETVIVDLRDLNKAEEVLKNDDRIKLLYLETPANPTIQCVDIDELTKLAKRNNLIVAVDNTFATPYLQQPFKYDVDFVFHSTTKFLNGHGTAIGGVIVGKDLEFMNGRMEKVHRLLGGNSNSFDAFLLTQGMKTLEVRMERHCNNAMQVAKFLQQNNSIAKVNYLGLTSHPDYSTANKQMKHPGAMLSFELKDGLLAGKKFIDKLQMCVRAVSLGTCDTLLSHPASMTHFGVPKEKREKYGITDGLIRMSVGIENVEDILNDLDQALK
ncbi:PLP-dependent transferase [Ginsengibacter hankyongi]|uniref:PLP-dependent transferase n=1 Tax=Ginsengibacter hankyongi TaxID=2607284 RepID=A0A5J5ILB2_9BACT|nr:PLP-dependent aspartate aminotransferase family protein [Ginsengibacter hankyongi]KAA9041511.1 PLP-dependent transferase [Ginsengibacter hankyongi]